MAYVRKEVIGDCTLYQGDCMDIMPTLESVDAVVTDPPYGIAKKWTGGSTKGWANAKSQTAARNVWDEKRPSGAVWAMMKAKNKIIWGGNYFADQLPPSRGWLVWNKPERNFSLAEAELAWTNIDSVIRVFDYRRSDSDRKHPTQKPLGVMEWCLTHIPDAKTIFDPFMGSGTTGVACVKTGRKFIGIELDPDYFDIACKRIEDAYKQPDMFVSAPTSKPSQEPLI